ncbi:protein of unknown function [Denitratisoma oestradiolicum]|uniref:Uncharacterized protein n=1 Tax=Denitratisoma oestradiolicum TaxID=311182 RepID=A0A6S6XR17_9PROT|nr:protein of unknown function [Denitratisoma oestradiolicum]
MGEQESKPLERHNHPERIWDSQEMQDRVSDCPLSLQ